jgi:GntR family transcriptional repressor for pyruvate dehydrogenase complex
VTVDIQPIVRLKIHQQVMNQIQDLIHTGRLRPGDRLPPERDLAQRFGVSRVAIRQALSVLQAMGLVESRIGDGTYARRSADLTVTALATVKPGPQGTVGEQLELRRIMEPQVAELAAERRTKADIEQLHQCLREQESKLQAGLPFVDEDATFHLTIARATKNHLLVQMIEGIHELLRDSRKDSLQTPEARSKSINGHRLVVLAIERKDDMAARRAMLRHLADVEILAQQFRDPRARRNSTTRGSAKSD